MDEVARIARTVLYEGYILWPYRRSALKNRQRWTFGSVFPQAYAERRGGGDPWTMQTQCLLEGDDDARVDVVVRFLHVLERRLAEERADGRVFVDELVVGGERLLAWDEAAEREAGAADLPVAALVAGRDVAVEIPAGRDEERRVDAASGRAGVVVRSWEPLTGTVRLRAERLRERLWRLTVRIENATPCDDVPREAALRRAFVSTHTILRARGGAFVSLTDPPDALRADAAACENVGTWPVLAGAEGETHTVLSSPIILPDHPRVAPESPGDLFDGGEIDELLVLNILCLSDAEREEVRATDPRAREILERCEALTPEQMMRLHGAIREFRPIPWGE